MSQMVQYLRALLTKRLSDMEDRGASAVEYGLLVAGIAVVVIVGVFALGKMVNKKFTDTCTAINSGSSCPAS